VLGLATGGGGCQCSAAGDSRPSPFGFLLAIFTVFLIRRRGQPASRRIGRAVAFVALGLVASFSSGCEVDPSCFENCEGDLPDAGPEMRDAQVADGCVPAGEELCNELDDDCDGLADEDFDLAQDPANCGACGESCLLPNAFATCEVGTCAVERCEIGYVDVDGNPTNGCEYECQTSGNEICDDVDNDCDTLADEDFDVTNDIAHCGACNNVCSFANAGTRCEDSACVMEECNPGFVDSDGLAENGCEYACSGAGVEVCNGVDDDCDMRIDEEFDLETDRSNCGRCTNECSFLNAAGVCAMGVCAIGACTPGFVDVDGDPVTGCEYVCTPTGRDVCNGRDDDCDGAVDEDEPSVGTACGSTTGLCAPGTNTCQFGAVSCVGGRGPVREECNGDDDDCDGRIDESTAAEPIAMVGARCGESNVGSCRFGTFACTGGAYVCGGSYVGAAPETCNGLDDDCDGTADDSPAAPAPLPASCTETRGVCAGRTPVCGGGAGWSCSFPTNYQPTESRCDGLDNDCDGTPDEGCLRVLPASDRRVDTGDASGAENSIRPTISGNGSDLAYAAWMDLRGSGGAHVLFNRWTQTGDSWGSPVQLDTSSGPAFAPELGVTGASGSNIAAVWADFRGGTSNREIWSRSSTTSGASFAASDTRANSGSDDSFGVDVAVSGTNVFAVYEAFITERSRAIYAVRSANGGATWGAPVRVSHGAGTTLVAATPRVAAIGSTAYVVWRDNRNMGLDIFFNRTMTSGTNGLSPTASDTRIDTGDAPGSHASFSPVVAAEGANVYIAWVDDRSGTSLDIYLNRSIDGGATFGATSTALDADPIPHDSIEPRVVAPAPGRAVVAWVDYRSGFADILARRTTTGGATFEAVQRLDTGTSPGTASSLEMELHARGDLVVAVWADDRRGHYDIFANYSLDGGAVFQPNDVQLNVRALTAMHDSAEPAVYVAGGAAHVVWVDHRGGANGDISYRRLAP
jgi:MYXO-CTERM domain-containing protein